MVGWYSSGASLTWDMTASTIRDCAAEKNGYVGAVCFVRVYWTFTFLSYICDYSA